MNSMNVYWPEHMEELSSKITLEPWQADLITLRCERCSLEKSVEIQRKRWACVTDGRFELLAAAAGDGWLPGGKDGRGCYVVYLSREYGAIYQLWIDGILFDEVPGRNRFYASRPNDPAPAGKDHHTFGTRFSFPVNNFLRDQAVRMYHYGNDTAHRDMLVLLIGVYLFVLLLALAMTGFVRTCILVGDWQGIKRFERDGDRRVNSTLTHALPLSPPTSAAACASQPCANGAECHEVQDDGVGYKCTCEAGYTGARCEERASASNSRSSSSNSPNHNNNNSSRIAGGDTTNMNATDVEQLIAVAANQSANVTAPAFCKLGEQPFFAYLLPV